MSEPYCIGEFVLESKIGEGGMGVVFRARQTTLDRWVALKLLARNTTGQSNYVERFHREAKSAAQLVHPNIIQIYTIGEHKGSPYFAMEYVEGQDLSKLLQSGESLTFDEIVEIARSVAKALLQAADRGIVHRDIKPGNIMVTRTGLVKVMDFGLAKATSSSLGLTMEGQVIGTPSYLSPEQGMGKEVDSRSDLYSLGCVVYECITGRVPFAADNVAAVIFKHLYEPVELPREFRPEIPETLEAVVLKLLAKRPDERYSDPGQLLEALALVPVNAALAEVQLAKRVKKAQERADAPEALDAPPAPPLPKSQVFTKVLPPGSAPHLLTTGLISQQEMIKLATTPAHARPPSSRIIDMPGRGAAGQAAALTATPARGTRPLPPPPSIPSPPLPPSPLTATPAQGTPPLTAKLARGTPGHGTAPLNVTPALGSQRLPLETRPTSRRVTTAIPWAAPPEVPEIAVAPPPPPPPPPSPATRPVTAGPPTAGSGRQAPVRGATPDSGGTPSPFTSWRAATEVKGISPYFKKVSEERWGYDVSRGHCQYAEGMAAEALPGAHRMIGELGDCLLCSNWSRRSGCAIAATQHLAKSTRVKGIELLEDLSAIWCSAGRFDRAVAILEDYIRESTDGPEGYRALARIYDRHDYMGKDRQRAIVLYARFIELAPFTERFSALEIQRAQECVTALRNRPPAVEPGPSSSGFHAIVLHTFRCFHRQGAGLYFAFGALSRQELVLAKAGEVDPDSGISILEMGNALQRTTSLFRRMKSERAKADERESVRRELEKLSKTPIGSLKESGQAVSLALAKISAADFHVDEPTGNRTLRCLAQGQVHELIFPAQAQFDAERCAALVKRLTGK